MWRWTMTCSKSKQETCQLTLWSRTKTLKTHYLTPKKYEPKYSATFSKSLRFSESSSPYSSTFASLGRVSPLILTPALELEPVWWVVMKQKNDKTTRPSFPNCILCQGLKTMFETVWTSFSHVETMLRWTGPSSQVMTGLSSFQSFTGQHKGLRSSALTRLRLKSRTNCSPSSPSEMKNYSELKNWLSKHETKFQR